MKIAYVRVSSRSQNEKSQISEIKKYDDNIDDKHIFIEKQSGKNFTNRPVYKEMKEKVLRSGDELVILTLDRLGRNYDEVKKERISRP